MPVVTHLFSVALLVAEDGAPDDVVIAALLHDTLEDTETTRDEIISNFNRQVADYIAEVSEKKELPWKERKVDYLALMETVSDGALLIAIADKVDNVESRNEEFEKEGEAFLKKWTRPNSDYIWFYGEALKISQERLPDHRLTKRYGEAFAQMSRLTEGK
ncbi:MAG: relA 1 [Parcubacteria group bacterium]|nr:relA 1 [Parcubacteria group bacterium]